MKKSKLLQRGYYFGNDNIILDKFVNNYDSYNFIKFFTGYADVTFALDSNNNIYVCGDNKDYLLGIGDNSKPIKMFVKLSIDNVKMVSIGSNHALLLTNDGHVYASGKNNYGQLGLGSSKLGAIYYNFTKLDIDDVKYISCGNGTSYIVKNDGTFFASGLNSNGQLGLEDVVDRDVFTLVDIDNVKLVSSFYNHVFILKNDNTLYGCGKNNNGQLGLSNIDVTNKFTKVDIENVEDIKCGLEFSILLKDNGSIYFTGSNSYGQFGNGTTNSSNVFSLSNKTEIKSIHCGSYHTIILDKAKNVYTSGNNLFGECSVDNEYYTTQITSFRKVYESANYIIAGSRHNILMNNKNKMLVSGYNNKGQLGCNFNEMILYNFVEPKFHDTDNLKHIYKYKDFLNVSRDNCEINNIKLSDDFHDHKQVKLTEQNMFILLNNGSLYACGRNNVGQLGLGDNEDRAFFCKVPIDNVVEIHSDRIGNITYLTKSDGTIWSCGNNSGGQLALGDTVNRNTFTKVDISNIKQLCIESGYVLALNGEGKILHTGLDTYVTGSTRALVFTPNDSSSRKIKKIATYESNAFAINEQDYLEVRGANSFYELGLGDNSAHNSWTSNSYIYYREVYVSGSNNSTRDTRLSPYTIKDILPFYKGCAVLTKNNILCISGTSPAKSSFYRFGDLGTSSTYASNNIYFYTKYNSPNYYSLNNLDNLNFMETCSCFIMNSKMYYCSSSSSSLKTSSATLATCADSYILYYYNNLLKYIDTGNTSYSPDYGYKIDYPIKNVKKLISSKTSSLVIDDNNNIYCIGANNYNKFGIGNNNSANITNLTNITDQYISYITIDEIKKVEIKGNSVFILKYDGTLYACGANNFGQLGLGDKVNRDKFVQVVIDDVDDIITSGSNTFAIKKDNSIYACGLNNYGQLGLGDTLEHTLFTKIYIENVKTIFCSTSTSYILKNDNTLYSCGINTNGQLGLKNYNNYNTFSKMDIIDVKKVSCSNNTVAILKNDNTFYMAGINNKGQLGLGSTTDSNTLIKILEDTKDFYITNNNTFIVSNTNKCKVSGENLNKCLGLNNTSSIFTFTDLDLENIDKIVCNDYATLFLTLDNKLYTAGSNSYGSAHTNAIYTLKSEDVKDIFVSPYSAYYLTKKHELYGSGINSAGQLGLKDLTTKTSYLKTADDVSTMITSESNSIIIKNDKDIFMCGRNVEGQLGLKSTYNVKNNNKTLVSEYIQMPFVLGDNIDIKRKHNCVVINNDTLIITDNDINYKDIFGNEYSGYNCIKLPFDNIKEVSVSRTHIIVLLNNGDLYGRGSNKYGELFKDKSIPQYDEFVKLDIEDVKHIECGNNYTYYTKISDNSLWAFGNNSEYQLSIGHNDPVSLPQKVTLSNVKNIYIHNRYNLVITENNDLYVQGQNLEGCFGLGIENKNVLVKNFTKAATNIKEVIQFDEKNIFLIDNLGNIQVAGKNNFTFKVDNTVDNLYEFSVIPTDGIDNIINMLSTDDTLYIIAKIDTDEPNIELSHKTLDSVRINLQDSNKNISKIEMFINGRSIDTLEVTDANSVLFEIPRDIISIGKNIIMFKAYSKFNNFYDTMFIYKEETGNENLLNSQVIIGGKIYNITNIITRYDNVIITLDRGLENNLAMGESISILVNNINVKVNINNLDTFIDLKLKEIKKVSSGYQEIYELEKSNITSVQPKITVEKGDKWTNIRRPSMLFSYDPSQFEDSSNI
ncbi:chromosome condensation regulator [Clostridioides difficile]|uniref:chromosome condensation regulator n=1 Tax=Clostridioides difficile TaxID=1496 RepID=UPI001C1381F9|nr:chromosome condensation regulator [Clostridioides difficile]MDF3817679.1 chromosome condensation regulator [Clostridioides difficile]HBF4283371.1 chromosome condensation regulator [Clostridioides difficile]HBF5048895.1 chromosome condensation regulator [Clostridioides difficile]HBF5114789.1 chromosome condensation regulator [Clostridioides difficile]HBF5876730.1 chromosome condensation regulator [Clostridioides difficile]